MGLLQKLGITAGLQGLMNATSIGCTLILLFCMGMENRGTPIKIMFGCLRLFSNITDHS